MICPSGLPLYAEDFDCGSEYMGFGLIGFVAEVQGDSDPDKAELYARLAAKDVKESEIKEAAAEKTPEENAWRRSLGNSLDNEEPKRHAGKPALRETDVKGLEVNSPSAAEQGSGAASPDREVQQANESVALQLLALSIGLQAVTYSSPLDQFPAGSKSRSEPGEGAASFMLATAWDPCPGKVVEKRHDWCALMDDLDDLIKTKKAPKTKAKAKAKAASNDDGPAPKAKTKAKKAPKAKAKAKTKAKAASNDDEPAPKAKAQVKKEDGEEEEEETPKDLVKKAPEPRGGKRGSRLSVGWPVLTVLAMSAGLLALVAAQRRAK